MDAKSRNHFVSVDSWHSEQWRKRVMEENGGVMVRAVSMTESVAYFEKNIMPDAIKRNNRRCGSESQSRPLPLVFEIPRASFVRVLCKLRKGGWL